MSATKCFDCGRPNAADARACIWCGVPLITPGSPPAFEPLRTEVDYLEGFERLDGPIAVGISVSPAGVEVRELMPGTRTILVPADSLISAKVTGPLRRVGAEPRGRTSGLLKLKPDRGSGSLRATLTLRYWSEGEARTVLFARNDESGSDVLQRFARTMTLLARLNLQSDVEE